MHIGQRVGMPDGQHVEDEAAGRRVLVVDIGNAPRRAVRDEPGTGAAQLRERPLAVFRVGRRCRHNRNRVRRAQVDVDRPALQDLEVPVLVERGRGGQRSHNLQTSRLAGFAADELYGKR